MDSPDPEATAQRVPEDPAHAFLPYPASPVAHAKAGPLTGLSFAVKDLFDIAGYPTGGGNPLVLVRSGIKQQTAPAIQALLDSGAHFVGKTVTDELAFSMNGKNVHFGTPRNGVVPERIPGGRRAGRRQRYPTVYATLQSAATPVARSAHRATIADSSEFDQRTVGFHSKERFRSHEASTRWGSSRATPRFSAGPVQSSWVTTRRR